MAFTDRIRLALRYLFRGKTVAALAPSWELMQPHYAIGANFEILVKEGYRKNELIFACIEKTADSASQIALQLKRKRDGQIIDEHPFLDLIGHPNDVMNESDFWGSVVVFQKLAGRAVYEIEANNRGLPVALWPLRPDWLKIKRSAKRPVISEYIYKVPGLGDQHLEPSQVLDFPIFDPLGEFRTYPPAAVAGRTGDVDNAATDYIKMIWEHGGIPQVYLKTTQVMNETAIADTRRRWRERYGGFKNWIEPAILDRDQDVQKLAWSFQEMGFEFLDARDEVRICMVLKIPPILIGAKAGLDASTYSNYGLARRSWWEDTLLPMYENYMDVIDRLLAIFDPNRELMAVWNIDKVRAFHEDQDKIWERSTNAFRAAAITRNEFLEQIGLPTRGPASDVYLQPFNAMEVPAKLPAKLLPDNGREGKALDVAGNAPDDEIRLRHERLYKKELMKYFDDQMSRIVKDARENGR